MISVELWRARIGTFNNKRCSGCSLSSLSSSTLASSHCQRHRGSTCVSQKEPSVALTSLSSSSLAIKEELQEFSSTDHHSVLTTSSTFSCSSQSCGMSSSFTASSSQSSSFFFPTSGILRSLSLLSDAAIALLIAIISQLLMIAGDIESNPGPKHGADDKPGLDDLLCMSYTGEDCRDTRFRLMDQLQPHWRRLAIALNFRHGDITVMEHKDDPVYCLLGEWLRGANQERDSRPVTWATLITALRDANIQEEANILEKCFVKAVPVTMSQPLASRNGRSGAYHMICPAVGGCIMRHGPIRVLVKPDVPEGILTLMVKYADMLLVLRTTRLSSGNLHCVKLFLSDFCDERSLRQCVTLCDVIDVLIEQLKIYIFNIESLDVSCKHFNAKIKESVQKYKQDLNEFLSTTSVKEFKNALQTQILDASKVESVVLKLDETKSEGTLRNLKKLAYHFFGSSSKALVQCEVGPGCVRITWLVPVSLVPTLRAMAERRSQNYLTKQGILQLVIGYRQIIPDQGQVSTIIGGTLSTDDLGHEWSKEMLSFKKHRLELSWYIPYPTLLYRRLQSAGLLPRDGSMKMPDVASTKLGVSELLDAIEEMINSDPGNFYKFIDELVKDSSMRPICNKLWYTALQVIPPTSSYSTTSFFFPSSSSFFFSHSSIAVTMKQYSAYLKDCYQQPIPDDDNLLTTTTMHYIDLAVVRKKKKEVHRLLSFSSTEILAPITLKEILISECQPGRRVLIEGKPGIGKTTLAWELCRKWEELDSLKQYELVVLVRLREKKAQEARCLEDLLPCGATTNMKELVAAIGRGKGVLILCDGFDELPDEQRQEGSMYIDLIKGNLLPEATIIVTSRPSVTLYHHDIDSHLEVIGFTEEQDIKRFAESVFSGDILEEFLSYITSNPPIYGMMYIPLNAVIVALIYQDSYNTDTPFPTTMTQLFDALIRALICRHLKLSHKSLHEFHIPSSLQCMKDIDQLPSLVAQQMVKLAKMAYEGVLEKRYIFTELSEDIEGLGIMKKITSLNVCTGPECSYTFLHLTLQEYMAALYSVINQSSELYYSHQIHGFKQNYVMRFVAGICSHSEYRDQPFYHDLVRIISENTLQHSLLLVQCAYECPSIMQDVTKGYSTDDVILVQPVLICDWYVTGYCIRHFDLKWGLSIHEVIKENAIDLLVQGIKSSPVATGGIQEMKISCTMPTSLSISQIFNKLKEFFQPQSLELVISSNATEDDALVMRQLIEPGSNLRSLVFQGYPTLIPVLLAQSSLEELTISNHYNEFEEPDLLPQMNTNLKKLVITHRLLVLLAKVLPNYTSLTCLIIVQKTASKDDLDLPVLTELVESHPTLEVLGIESFNDVDRDNLLQLVETAANSQLKQLLFSQFVYNFIPLDIKEQYKHMLGELPYNYDWF